MFINVDFVLYYTVLLCTCIIRYSEIYLTFFPGSYFTGEAQDIYWSAQCLYKTGQYHRSAHTLKSNELDKKFLAGRYLAARCHVCHHEKHGPQSPKHLMCKLIFSLQILLFITWVIIIIIFFVSSIV